MADEVEGKLIITATDAQRAYKAIALIDGVAGLRVGRREVEDLSDVFFDGPARPLFAAGLALRVRTSNSHDLITIKGEARVVDGVITRDELEVDWSPEGLDDVLEALNQAGVSMGNVEAAREATSARDAMEALGFLPGSTRFNRRTALTLMRAGSVVAELDVDNVSFNLDERMVRHYEVECEAKGDGDSSVVRLVLDDLRPRYEGLRPWSVSKLALAEILEGLAQDGRLEALLDGERLQSSAYDLIESTANASAH